LFFLYEDLWYRSPYVGFCYRQVHRNANTITTHRCHHFSALSLEHLILFLKSNLALHPLLTLHILDPKYLSYIEVGTVQIVDGWKYICMLRVCNYL
jgi:hypothetical protein